MNARQKAKRLKKEIEALKEDKSTHGNLWLKIDGFSVEQELPFSECELSLANENMTKLYFPRNVYTVIVGSMRAKFCPISPDDRLIIVDSKKLDEVIEEVPPYVPERDC